MVNDDIFLDEWSKGKDVPSEQKEEANQWARDFLIPPKYTAELLQLNSKEQVGAFANRLSIHPGIVVGRLQHDETISQIWINELRKSLRFT